MEVFVVEKFFVETCHDWFSREDYEKVTSCDIVEIFDSSEKAQDYIKEQMSNINTNIYNAHIRREYAMKTWMVK